MKSRAHASPGGGNLGWRVRVLFQFLRFLASCFFANTLSDTPKNRGILRGRHGDVQTLKTGELAWTSAALLLRLCRATTLYSLIGCGSGVTLCTRSAMRPASVDVGLRQRGEGQTKQRPVPHESHNGRASGLARAGVERHSEGRQSSSPIQPACAKEMSP